jgi:hypothetical protein
VTCIRVANLGVSVLWFGPAVGRATLTGLQFVPPVIIAAGASPRAYLGTVPDSEIDRLRAENDELRRRVEAAEHQIDVLRREALERRAKVRELAESLPAAVSRRRLMLEMLPGSQRRSARRTAPQG